MKHERLVEFLKTTAAGKQVLRECCPRLHSCSMLAICSDGQVKLYSDSYVKLTAIQRIRAEGWEQERTEDRMLELRLPKYARRLYDETLSVGTLVASSISLDEYRDQRGAIHYLAAIDTFGKGLRDAT